MSQIQYLLPRVDKYFKANLHTHTNISDGGPTPEEMKEAYKGKGYQILSLTDHNVVADHSALNDEDFLFLTGAEYDISQADYAAHRLWKKTYHLNFIAKEPGNLWQPYLPEASKPERQALLEKVHCDGTKPAYDVSQINALIARGNENGFLVMYNHPTWSLQDYSDYAGLKGLWGMELCNYDCVRSGFDDRNNSRVYSDLVNLGNRVFPLGTDDSHSFAAVGGAWIMVGAEKLEYGCVIDALEKGDFYTSTGSEIFELSLRDKLLTVKCSDARCITVETGTRFGKRVMPKSPDTLLRSAVIDMSKWLDACTGDSPLEWFRVTVHGPYGGYAATRAFWFDQL